MEVTAPSKLSAEHSTWPGTNTRQGFPESSLVFVTACKQKLLGIAWFDSATFKIVAVFVKVLFFFFTNAGNLQHYSAFSSYFFQQTGYKKIGSYQQIKKTARIGFSILMQDSINCLPYSMKTFAWILTTGWRRAEKFLVLRRTRWRF